MEELTPPNAQGSPTPDLGRKVNNDPPKSQPFQCCLQEYGIRLRASGGKRKVGEQGGSDGDVESEDDGGEGDDGGWERRWRMFGTTIV